MHAAIEEKGRAKQGVKDASDNRKWVGKGGGLGGIRSLWVGQPFPPSRSHVRFNGYKTNRGSFFSGMKVL